MQKVEPAQRPFLAQQEKAVLGQEQQCSAPHLAEVSDPYLHSVATARASPWPSLASSLRGPRAKRSSPSLATLQERLVGPHRATIVRAVLPSRGVALLAPPQNSLPQHAQAPPQHPVERSVPLP